jgi:hypothetical protein
MTFEETLVPAMRATCSTISVHGLQLPWGIDLSHTLGTTRQRAPQFAIVQARSTEPNLDITLVWGGVQCGRT